MPEAPGQEADGRRNVQLDDKREKKRIKEDNLILLCSKCLKEEPRFRCSLCHGASYCNATCQKGHWNQHMKACSALEHNGAAKKNDSSTTNDRLPDGRHIRASRV